MTIKELVKPIHGKNYTIGSYPGINGKDAISLKQVEPTKEEVYAIIRHHVKLLRGVDEQFAIGNSGSWEIRQLPYSNDRIKYYSQFVDESEVQNIFNQVYKGFKKNHPDYFEDDNEDEHYN